MSSPLKAPGDTAQTPGALPMWLSPLGYSVPQALGALVSPDSQLHLRGISASVSPPCSTVQKHSQGSKLWQRSHPICFFSGITVLCCLTSSVWKTILACVCVNIYICIHTYVTFWSFFEVSFFFLSGTMNPQSYPFYLLLAGSASPQMSL